jgi:hypothetical protein
MSVTLYLDGESVISCREGSFPPSCQPPYKTRRVSIAVNPGGSDPLYCREEIRVLFFPGGVGRI